MSETKLQRVILDGLNAAGYWAFRVNSGMRGTVRLAPPGTPDICLPALGWMEVKDKEGKLRPAQVRWHERAAREGVRVAVVRSLADALRAAIEWKHGYKPV